jgi:endonuclease/exonuclease/phosphatase (EEP) superfamily protein YafD
VDHALRSNVESCKLASINVFSGNPTPERVIGFIEAADADVILLLEVTPEWERRLTTLAGRYPHSRVRAQSDNFGIALYSRFPISAAEFVPLSPNNLAIIALIAFPQGAMHVIGAHPFPPAGAGGAGLRNQQLEELASHVAMLDRPCVLAGDLNITPFSPYFDQFLANARLNDPRRGLGLLPTWPVNHPSLGIPIDHCLLGDGMAARLIVGPDVGSDHRPLLAELQLVLD